MLNKCLNHIEQLGHVLYLLENTEHPWPGGVTGMPLITVCVLSIGTGLIISMLLLLQLANYRMTPSIKHRCQKFGMNHLFPLCVAGLHCRACPKNLNANSGGEKKKQIVVYLAFSSGEGSASVRSCSRAVSRRRGRQRHPPL